MLCCLMELGMFVFGIVSLVRGKCTISGNKVVEGAPARVMGGILLLPFIVANGIEVVMGIVVAAQGHREGREYTFLELQKKLAVPASIAHIATMLLFLGIVIGIAIAYAKPPDRFRREAYDLGEQKYYGGSGDGGGGDGGGNPFGGLDDRYRSS